MKKLISFVLGVFVTISLAAQPPMGPRVQGTPLPNQFRDFVDHQQRLNMERPQIEKKDGKVIITMSEEQYKRMQQMRMAQRFRPANFNQQPCCGKCEMNRPRPHRGPRHKRI